MRHNRLGARLLIGVLLISGLLAFVISGIQLAVEYGKDLHSIDERLNEIKNTTTDPLAAAGWHYDQKLLVLQLDGLVQLPDIQYVNANIFGLGEFERGERPPIELQLTRRLPLIYSDHRHQKKVGELLIVATKENALSRLWQRMGFEVFAQFLKTLLVSGLLLLFFHYLVTKRLGQLAQEVQRLRVARLDAPILAPRLRWFSENQDELDEVLHHLDTMRRSLRAEIHDRQLAEAALQRSEERLRLALEGVNDGVWDWDLVTDQVYLSPSWQFMLGYDKDDSCVDVTFIRALIHDDDAERVKQAVTAYLNGAMPVYRDQFRLCHKDGHYIWVLSRGVALRGDHDRPYRFIGTNIDVSAQIKTEESLRQLSLAMDQTPVAVAICDPAFAIQYHNPMFLRLLGVPNQTISGQQLKALLGASGDSQGLVDAVAAGLAWQGEIKLSHADGACLWLAVKCTPTQPGNATATGSLLLMEDVTSRVQYEAQLAHQANYDTLTELPNRNLAGDRLQTALAKAGRTEGQVGIVFLDLDDFKLINDSMGHKAGDELLQQVGQRLLRCIREQETVARFGGDEFVVILPDITDPMDVEVVVERMIATLAAPFELGQKSVFITASIGISLFPHDGATADILIQHADTAMYKSKASGRSTFHFYTQQLNEEAHQRLLIETELRYAVVRDELEVYYQPILRCRDNRIIGAEALLRWQSRSLGVVPTETFIRIAEKSHLIKDIDRWVLNRACQQLSELRQTLDFGGYLAVNVSSRELQDSALVGTVMDSLSRHYLQPADIQIEITERSVINARAEVIAQLHALDDCGIKLCIDDFGTGYSALAYLLTFPFKVVKIDRSFICDIDLNERNAALTRNIITMVHDLGMQVVAEGIERETQMGKACHAGCDLLQGFFIARPLEFDAFTQLLAEQEKPHAAT